MSEVQHATALWTESDLRRYRAEIIEECAQEIEAWEHADEPLSYKDLIRRVRALKDKP